MDGKCVRCGDPVPTNNYDMYRQVIGWEKLGKGSASLTNKELTGQVMHYACMVKTEHHPGQGEMFV